MGSRSTQYAEGSCCLPEGYRQIGHDVDTRRYLFKDKHDILYQGEPGVEYGKMTRVSQMASVSERSSPSPFSSPPDYEDRSMSPPAGLIPKTFQEILPPELITTASLSGDSRRSAVSSLKSIRNKFKESLRKATLPKMHNVVTNSRRPATSIRRPRASDIPSSGQHRGSYDDEDARRLVWLNSGSYIALDRSSSVATSGTSAKSDAVPSIISVDTSRQ
ncbi:hypothetical protein HYPSUDRAFT_67803 [Hypholoma sublateritium FD-334 SS-4]|uniref:Uncharacterized protein n=1 Tax=Hypholoma sublateritium (strain FD-334 SS-4) TaxID=945553 RepID=A0A0D2NR82_HYPSF|nr:hypothetical protein HYPSUDRAFT_67803 [Hypholoma sublateritium FD-334 SS-4]